MNSHRVRFGLVLPHFGSDPTPKRILDVAVRAEEAGFDSLWLRDRLVAGAPHGLILEAGGTTFYEPLVTAAAVAAATSEITIGTAVLLPNRHPLQLVQQLGTLAQLAPRRLIVGLGLGVGSHNFESLGLRYEDRDELFRETMTVLRGAEAGSPLLHSGAHFSFGPVEIDPLPGRHLPIYYGGVSRAAVRRAVTHCDGWIAGRLPLATFAARLDLLTQLTSDPYHRLDIATMPITVVDEGDGRLLGRANEAVALLARSAEGASDWLRPPSGRFETIEDLAGLLIAGSPERCTAEARRIVQNGVSHLIFDLRIAFDEIERQLELLQIVLADMAEFR